MPFGFFLVVVPSLAVEGFGVLFFFLCSKIVLLLKEMLVSWALWA